MKRYDQAYFDRWYRNPRHARGQRADLGRQVALALALADVVLARRARTVLDIGAGEGRWGRELQRQRRSVRYVGVEPSADAVRRYGRRRNLRLGDFASLHHLGLTGPFDLVIVADVLHYLTDRQLGAAVLAMAPFVDGLAFCPTFTGRDAIEGDRHEFQPRRAATYRRAFAAAGLVQVGPWAWAPRDRTTELAELERVVGEGEG
jgi:SAM-dependent methyltransferase